MPVTDPPQVDIRLLGPVSVAVDGRDVPIGSPKQRTVLAMLALARQVSVDALAEELWRETPPASVAATVHTLVSRLRRTLEAAGGGVAIHAGAGGYVMDVEPHHVDVSRFQERADAGRCALADGSPVEAARRFREALALWRGGALADLADRDFARVAAVRLDGARLDVAEDLADAELAAGRPAAALEVLEPLIAEHPFRERLRGQQMIALYRLGRQADALAAYQELRRTLADELGLEPTPALQTLERQILLQSPELEGPSAAATVGIPDFRLEPPDAAPDGTLAFLFTDIESSTRRWEGDRAAMTADLARHDAVLSDAVTLCRGTLFTHTGDGLGAAFPTVSDALGAAVTGQRELAGVTWSGATPLQVRMAVHAGAAEARAGTFLGPTLNRTARLLDHATGGQILCSQAAADLARDDLPAGVTLVDVGERRLEGLSRTERVSQVLHPDLAEMLLAPPTAANRLYGSLTSFVGRETELAELSDLLPQTRLLTITGLGGVGKTRLALELASRVDKQFDDGACVVEFAPMRQHRPLAAEVLTALGAGAGGPSSGISYEDRLCRVLAERHLLLVLDNCEHLLEPVAALVHSVLRSCPRITVLATSREVLSLPGESAWAAPGLSLPPSDAQVPEDLAGSDAAALFVSRARTAQPGFGATAANAGALSRICRRLDGIPLALELAAARVRVLGVAQLAERLDDRFRLLTGGPRSTPSRHQTLQAAMDWSFDMLSATEQRMLQRLAVYPQSFDLDAATAVADDGADPLDVLDLLTRLIDKSLLVPEGAADTARYRLLETVREYGTGKLSETEKAEAVHLHQRHFVGLFRTWSCSGDAFNSTQWALRVAPDRENFQMALAGAVAEADMESAAVLVAGLASAWFWWGSVPTLIDSIEPEKLRCSEPSLHIEALLGLAAAGWISGRFRGHAISELYQRALDLADSHGTSRHQGLVRYYLGYAARTQGDCRTGRSWMEEALTRLGEDDTLERAWTHSELGWIDMTEGQTAAAQHHFRRGLAILDAAQGDAVQEVHLHAALALADAAGGSRAESMMLAREAVGAARTLPFPGLLVMTLVRSAETAAVAGAPAGPDLVEAIRILRDHEAGWWVAAAVTVAALAHESQGRPERAARLLAGAAVIAAARGEDPQPLPVMATLVAAARRRLDAALDPEVLAEQDTAGRRMSISQLLQTALDDLNR
jgi:predicted ATPase/DNA-binding SARP family transcriptional activator